EPSPGGGGSSRSTVRDAWLTPAPRAPEARYCAQLPLQPHVRRIAVDVEEPEDAALQTRRVVRRELLELDRHDRRVLHDPRVRLLPRSRCGIGRGRGQRLVDEAV